MASRTRGGSPQRCPSCGATVIKQLVGQRAALKVTVDAEPIPRVEALALAEPNRLVWCLVVLAGGGSELRWGCRRACGHGAVIEHRCPAGMLAAGDGAEGTLW